MSSGWPHWFVHFRYPCERYWRHIATDDPNDMEKIKVTLNYQAIRAENEGRYGTDIGRIGPMLLANRYDDRTHFLYELLQNAEDAVAELHEATERRSVRFQLTGEQLLMRHFGKLFDEKDVRGICGIAESSKNIDFTTIGRFGIGFKSVYAFTDRPEVHSGTERFAIESFVWPVEITAPCVDQGPDETLIILPLRDPSDTVEIQSGLHRLGARTLLFLRQIEEIEWAIDGGPSGIYLRNRPDWLDKGVRKVTLIGQVTGNDDFEENWLLFSSPVSNKDGFQVGHVEVGFLLGQDPKGRRQTISPLPKSPLVVYFPTVFETHLGFLVQGPYRTTPSRDNVPINDPWNKFCVEETTGVLNKALAWLRENDLLDVNVVRCLPLDRSKFGATSMFAPLFDSVKATISSEPCLPRHNGGHTTGSSSALARTQELRELFRPEQLALVLKTSTPREWVTGEISEDRTPEIYKYLTQELGIEELRPESIVPKLTSELLEAQPDPWISQLYVFLSSQRALLSRVKLLPLIRLTNGRHVVPFANGREQAFLPGSFETGFPTIRRSVCTQEQALEFLRSLGLTEPDPVDDVIWNVIPKYRQSATEVVDDVYEADIQRILSAFRTDSDRRRKQLIDELARAYFVRAIDAGSKARLLAKPTDVYLATDRLQALLNGAAGINLVDRDRSCLQGDEARALLEACGALRYLRPVAVRSLAWEKRRDLRQQAGHAETSGYNDRVEDWTLHGLDAVLQLLPTLDEVDRDERAGLLWEELAHLEERRGKGVFTGEYIWTHYGKYNAAFDATFVEVLNEKAWVPGAEDCLLRPELVLFEPLQWKPNPFLQSKIRFKPPIIDQLAAEVGIEPAALDLLRQLGVTTASELRAKLGLNQQAAASTDQEHGAGEHGAGAEDKPDENAGTSDDTHAGDGGAKHGGEGGPGTGQDGTPGEHEEPEEGGTDWKSACSERGDSGRHSGRPSGSQEGGTGKGHESFAGQTIDGSQHGDSDAAGQRDTSGDHGAPPFVSYVGTSQKEQEPDSHGEDTAHRRELEEKGIRFILDREKDLVPTPYGNPGFDLYERDEADQPKRWVEVKALSGVWKGREVVLTRSEYECAREHTTDYWLYVVEHAADPQQRRVTRIQDPAGRARNFKFDHGWAAVAHQD